MRTGKNIPVWFAAEDQSKLEEAVTLAGYKHISKYIRDKALNRNNKREELYELKQQELLNRVTNIEHQQKNNRVLLTIILSLIQQRATTGEINSLIAACEKIHTVESLNSILPNLSELINRFNED